MYEKEETPEIEQGNVQSSVIVVKTEKGSLSFPLVCEECCKSVFISVFHWKTSENEWEEKGHSTEPH